MTTASSAPGAPAGCPDPAGTGPVGATDEAARRAGFREFVRRHHPDVGGDPEAFRAGLARWREVLDRAPTDVAGDLAGDLDDPRFDGPIVGVRHVTLHRLGRFGRRLVRRYDPRPGSARVR